MRVTLADLLVRMKTIATGKIVSMLTISQWRKPAAAGREG